MNVKCLGPRSLILISSCDFPSTSSGVGHQEFPVQAINIDFQVSCVPQEPKTANWRNPLTELGLRASISGNDFVNHDGNCMADHSTTDNPPLANNEEQFKEVLEDLYDKHLMAKVDAFCTSVENSMPSSMAKTNTDVTELDFDCYDEKLDSTPAAKLAEVTEPPFISREDSFEDLLLNLPRISSDPHLLFDVP